MLIRFIVSNFLSFYEDQELSLFPSKVRLHKDHVFETNSTKTNILKSAMIYGANSSGKSNLLKAIKFAQNIIVSGSKSKQYINVPIFKLTNKKSIESKFIFEFLINNNCYEYGFGIKDGIISREWLKKTLKYNEKMIFHRVIKNGKSDFLTRPKFRSTRFRVIFDVSSIEIRNNQLLLNLLNSKREDVIESIYRDVYYWFSNKLKVIFPNSKNLGINIDLMRNVGLKDFYKRYLDIFDTGIDGIDFHEYDLDDENVRIPKPIKIDVENELESEDKVFSISSRQNENYCIKRKGNKLIAYKLKAIHKFGIEKGHKEFDFYEESDGTNRIFDLLPMLYGLINSDNVVLIDEIDRSLHALIPSKMYEVFFRLTKYKKSQFITTTHDLSLLDLTKFRRDEIWFIKKNRNLQSNLYSLEEFKERYDKELKKAYLSGRYGAIPILSQIYRED